MPRNISSILINAATERVWDAVTNPEQVKRWQFGSELTTSWQPGSPIRFTTPWEGKVLEQWGTVLDFRPNESLAYSLFAPGPGREDVPENYFTMTYVLQPQGDGTLLQIIQEDNRPGAVQEEEKGADNPVLQALKTVAES